MRQGNGQLVLRAALAAGTGLFLAMVAGPAAGSAETTTAPSQAGGRTTVLGAHEFGRLRPPDAVVARAGPGEVGFYRGVEASSFGPWSFDVAADGSVWLLDEVNDRLLVWQPRKPARPRAVPLPFKAPVDFAVSPDGTIYVTSKPAQEPHYLYALTPGGEVRWKALDTSAEFHIQLRIGPDGALYMVTPGDVPTWTPVTSPAGKPLPLAEQRRRTSSIQPLPGGMRLVVGSGDAHERRFTLTNQTGKVVRAWRVTSQTTLGEMRSIPALVGDDLVITLGVARQTAAELLREIIALRLTATEGRRAQYALDARAVWGDELTSLRVGPDGALYQLRTSPTTGASIARYSDRPSAASLGGTAPPTTQTTSPTTTATPTPPTTPSPTTTYPIPTSGSPAVARSPVESEPASWSTLWLVLAAGTAAAVASVGGSWMWHRRRPGQVPTGDE